jgi:predicted O-methyltransferase YrrM
VPWGLGRSSAALALGTVVAAVERIVREPLVLPDLVLKARSRLTAARHQRRLGEYADVEEVPAVGLARMLGVDAPTVRRTLDTSGFRRVHAELDAHRTAMPARRLGGAGGLEACYAIVRITRPRIVLETGVAHGYSSAVILQALQDNGHGRMFSVDLPAFRPGTAALTGDAVPERLRSRWELNLGSDRRVIPTLLSRAGPIDFFFYDSDTAYESMLGTWELVWPHLRPGAVLALNRIHTKRRPSRVCGEARLVPDHHPSAQMAWHARFTYAGRAKDILSWLVAQALA